MKICPVCGAEVGDNEPVCPICGVDMTDVPVEEEMPSVK